MEIDFDSPRIMSPSQLILSHRVNGNDLCNEASRKRLILYFRYAQIVRVKPFKY